MAASLTAARQQLTLLPTARPLQMAYRVSQKHTLRLDGPTSATSANRPLSTSTSLNSPTSGGGSGSGSGSGGPFAFHVAASFTGKDRPWDPSTHIFHFNPYNRFQPTKGTKRSRPDSGHDAFFASRVGETGAVALGVADGVGGWTDSGVDPADFSHGLCGYMASAAYEHASSSSPASPSSTSTPDAATTDKNGPPRLPTARSILQSGYQSVCEDPSIRAGGSTACVAVASPDGGIDIANLGDSGFLQLRLGGVHAHSSPQTHAFNTPFQLSVVPPSVAARMAAFGGAQLSDFPRDADVSRHACRHGDVLVFASDGVWDNLFNQDILRVASRVMTSAGAWVTSPPPPQDGQNQDGVDAQQTRHDSGFRVAEDLHTLTGSQDRSFQPEAGQLTLQSVLAAEITSAAKAASINTKRDGPFAKDVQKWYPHENWRGGKIDDIVVVVAVVTDKSKSGDSGEGRRPQAKL